MENMTPSTELPDDFCAGIGPLLLGVVLVFFLLFVVVVVSSSFSHKNVGLENFFNSVFTVKEVIYRFLGQFLNITLVILEISTACDVSF